MSQPTFEAPPLDKLGELLPAYEFELLIAVGGMGAVYKARQLSLDRDVAIKILPQEMSGDPEFRASFQTEARAMARLNHPNLIGVYDSGTVDGMLYIVMEYVAGKPLYYSSYGLQIDPVQAVQLIQGICAGLGHAHENGIIHRDIKPANILLTPRAEPKIGDFGLARPTDSEGSGLAMGTPGYTAPEVLTNPTEADRRSDLFAVGVILYELLTGQRQEPGAAPPSTLAEVDVRMDAIWKRATHPDPEKRYSDAQAFQAALTEWTNARGKLAAGGRRPALVTAPAPNRPALAAASAAAPGGPAAAAFQPRTNWPLARNLLIISVLVVTTVIVWSNLESARAKRDQENAATLERSRAKSGEAGVANAGKPATTANDPAPVSIPSTSPPRPSDETTAESLKRLRSALAGGSRVEMPVGTLAFGDGHALLINQPMTWRAAAAFAEEHGGHLALPLTAEDVEWVSQKAADDGAVWIGAGRSGRDGWSLANGTAWPLPTEPRGGGSHASINRLGLVRATEASETLPFLIQWQADGSNPASLMASLTATRNSLATGTPIYPPGTASHEGRNFLLVVRPVNWEDAVELAESAGGLLAVPATPAEAEFLEEFTASQASSQRLWIGGKRVGDQWAWISGEAWQSARWIDSPANTGDNSALLLRPAKGWDAASPSERADGFIIEWSEDASLPADPAAETPAADFDLIALTSRATDLVAAADKKRLEQLAANAGDYSREMDTWVRGLSKSEQQNWQPNVDVLKTFAESGRVPSTAPKGVPLSAQMAKISEHRALKQQEIDAAFLAEAEKIRAAYHTRVREAAASASAAGQRNLVESLTEVLETAAAVEPWVRSLGFEPTPAPDPEPELPSARRGEGERRDRDRERQDERIRELERMRRDLFPNRR